MISFIKKRLFNLVYGRWDKNQIKTFRRIKGLEILYVIDIDNTLTINEIGKPLNRDHPTPRRGVINVIREKQDQNDKIVFLSARDFREYQRTKGWLADQGIFSDKSELYLVKSAASKLFYLKLAAQLNSKVVYIDDLSFNHENGSIKFYHDVISEVSEIDVEYRGVEFINQFEN